MESYRSTKNSPDAANSVETGALTCRILMFVPKQANVREANFISRPRAGQSTVERTAIRRAAYDLFALSC
jgi:hypothetical protein